MDNLLLCTSVGLIKATISAPAFEVLVSLQKAVPQLSSDCQYYCGVCHALCQKNTCHHGKENIRTFLVPMLRNK